MEEVKVPDIDPNGGGQVSGTRTLSEVIDSHCVALQQEKPADEPTQQRYREYLDTILKLMGDRDISAYAHKDLLTLKSYLLKWPANAGKGYEYRDKTVAEILRMKVAKPLDKRIVDSKYMEKIFAVFQHAYRNGWIDRDITQNMSPSLTVAEQRAAKRKIYSAAELNKIFASLPFHQDRPHLAWVPLIAAFSGALAGEICRLRVSDIRVNHAIPYLVITGEDAKGNLLKDLRDQQSLRLVPVHPVLVEVGLLRLVAQRQAQGRELLFEKRRRDGECTEPLTGAHYSHTFELFNRRFITKDLRKGFDSFRGNVQHDLQLKGVTPELSNSITGLVPQFEEAYLAAPDALLTQKYSALAQLRYPSLDLQLLKERFNTLEGAAGKLGDNAGQQP